MSTVTQSVSSFFALAIGTPVGDTTVDPPQKNSSSSGPARLTKTTKTLFISAWALNIDSHWDSMGSSPTTSLFPIPLVGDEARQKTTSAPKRASAWTGSGCQASSQIIT